MAAGAPLLLKFATSAAVQFAQARIQQEIAGLTEVGSLDKISASLKKPGAPIAMCYGQEAVVNGIISWLHVGPPQKTTHRSTGQVIHRYKADMAITWCDTFGIPIHRVNQIRFQKRMVYNADPSVTLVSSGLTVERFVESSGKVIQKIFSDDPDVDLSRFVSGSRINVSGFNAGGNNGNLKCLQSMKLNAPGESAVWLRNGSAVTCSGSCGTATLTQTGKSFVNNDLKDINHHSETGVMEMPGSNFHEPDPLMQSILGENEVETYRGRAVSVIERLKLKHYGSSVPEPEAVLATSSSPVPLSDVIENMLDRTEKAITDLGTPIKIKRDVSDLTSTIVRGATFRPTATPLQMMQVLSLAYNMTMQARGETLAFFRRESAERVTIDSSDLAAHVFGAEYKRQFERTKERPQQIPTGVEVRYYNASNGYEQDSETYYRTQGAEENIESIELPLTLVPDEALTIAKRNAYLAETIDHRSRIFVPQKLELAESDIAALVDEHGRSHSIIIDSVVNHVDGTTEIDGAEEQDHALATVAVADVRRGDDPPRGIQTPPEMLVHAFECGPIEVADMRTPSLFIGVNSYDVDQFPSVYDLYESADGVTYGKILTELAGQATIGIGQGTLGAPVVLGVMDEVNTIDVYVNGRELVSATDQELFVLGQNRAMLGNEVIAFRTPTALGDNVYRLSGLLRGLLNTERFVATHGANEPFTLISDGQYHRIGKSAADVGQAFYEDEDPDEYEEAIVVLGGETVKPWAPTAVTWDRQNTGSPSPGIRIDWVRRTREPGPVLGSHPLIEEVQKYRVRVLDSPGGTQLEDYPVKGRTFFNYSESNQIADGITPGDPITVAISQWSALLGAYSYEVEATVG